MRINGFEQIKAFNSWLFNNADKQLTTSHVALYYFLINQNNRNNWVEWFKLPYDLGMAGSCIGSRNTYYKCLQDLHDLNLIEYKKGINNFKAPLVKLHVLNIEQAYNTALVPLSEPLTNTLHEPLYEPLPEHIYKLITDNLELVTSKLHVWISESKNDSKKIYRAFKHLSLTIEDYNKLSQDYEKSDIDDILDKIENYKANKNYTSLYLTALNWLKKDKPKKEEVDLTKFHVMDNGQLIPKTRLVL